MALLYRRLIIINQYTLKINFFSRTPTSIQPETLSSHTNLSVGVER